MQTVEFPNNEFVAWRHTSCSACIAKHGDFMPPSESQPIITVENVSKHFGEFQALKNVSLEVNLGERVVICGPSGSGKSTLIRCINQLEIHEAGSIVVGGVELDGSKQSLKSIRATVGMVFQQFNLFPHLTIIDNLTLGPIRARKMPKADARDLAMRYLERVDIPEQADKYPRQLSGDEVLEVMAELATSGMTMICVTHETGFARRVADKMVFMDFGEIVEMSDPEKFFTAPESQRCRDFLDKILHH
jgi:ABC-type polar amino acid transport system ATPase subunit